jgi:hypothetical protein
MESSSFGFLFGNTTTIVADVDEPQPPPAQLDPFKIPMKIVERLMDNYYSGDGTVHPGDHLLFIHELCELFKCAGISPSQVKRKLFSLSLKGRAEEWYLMTHKYRGCIVVLLINKSVEPNEEQKVLTSGFDQGFTVNASKRVFRGI